MLTCETGCNLLQKDVVSAVFQPIQMAETGLRWFEACKKLKAGVCDRLSKPRPRTPSNTKSLDVAQDSPFWQFQILSHTHASQVNTAPERKFPVKLNR